MILGYCCALLVGISLGLVGGGGSILAVPILVYLMQVPPATATGYSLFVVGVSAAIGAQRYYQRRQIDFATGLQFALPSFAGVYIARKHIVANLPDQLNFFNDFSFSKDFLIMSVFAIMMIVTSVAMMRKTKSKPVKNNKALTIVIIMLEGLGVGLLTGFVGAGGGFLIVPALVILAGMEMKVAVGTSLFIIAAKSAIGFLGDLSVSAAIDWSLLLVFTGCSVLGIFIGNYVSRFVSGDSLKPVFGGFILLMGTFVLIKETWL